MKKIIRFSVLSLISISFLSSAAFAENIAVIVNEKSPVFSIGKASLDIREVKDIFLGKTKFWKGAVIKAVNQKDKALLSNFIEKICNMRLSDYQGHWVKLELEMGLSSPKVLETSKDIIRYIQYEKNAIGYVPEDEIKGVSGIKTVLSLTE